MTLRDALLQSLDWRLIGPHRGGRVVAVTGVIGDPQTYYFGACAGGVWKTVDAGTTWRNVSDGFFGTAAVGAIQVSASDPNVLYVGTGESTIRGNVSHGDGVYTSTDAGKTWRNIGLRETRHIGKIRIHPTNPEIVYVAALGHAWGPNAERGVYRSKNGGETWELVLHKSADAGSHDLTMDPTNPRVLYASVWQTRRFPHTFVSGGPESGLWKTTDGGDTWSDLSRRPGLPQGTLGKIGVALSPARPERVWAIIEAEDGGLFRTDDGGATWEKVSEAPFLRTRAWYYCHLYADPVDSETVWGLDYMVWKSVDGGANFQRVPSQHGDEHDLWINPDNTENLIKGDDGGACVTFTGGRTWSSIYNQPTAQLYHVIADDRFPYRVYGSQQDNTAISLPSMSVDGAIHERDWYEPGGGESGYIAVKHDDPDLVVASGPIGPRAFNDRMRLYNHRTGQKRDITVWPELFGWARGAIDLKYRFQWTFPIFFSRHDPDSLYVAGNHVFRSRDLGSTWEMLSPDLTRNDPTRLQPSGGPITRDNTGAEVYCTIFTLVESPHTAGVLWAGSDDGLVHLSRNGGKRWANITPRGDSPAGGLPEWALVNGIEPSPHDEGTAYLCATRYKLDDTAPYLYKTTDWGTTWTKITGDLPADAFTRVIRADPHRRGLLYCGTETGIFASFDDGAHWHRLGGNLPVVPVHDLIVKGTDMVVATHGRAFWILDDLTPLHQLADGGQPSAVRDPHHAGGTQDVAFHLFQPRPAVRVRVGGGSWGEERAGYANYDRAATSIVAYLPVKRGDGWGKEYLNGGKNPPNGLILHYFLADAPQSLTLEIVDAAGHLVRSYATEDLPHEPGINRFVWDMRHAGVPDLEADDLDVWQRPVGPLVLPGMYTVRLRADGHTRTQEAQIMHDPRLTITDAQMREQHDLLMRIRDRLAQTNAAIARIRTIRAQTAIWEARFAPTKDEAASAAVLAAARDLHEQIGAVERALIDTRSRDPMLHPIALNEKWNALFDHVDSADYPPTANARAVFGDLSARLDAHLAQLANIASEEGAILNRAIAATNTPAVLLT